MAGMIEYATYQIRKEVREDDFLKAVEAAMNELKARSIPIQWEFYRTADGAFVDMIRSEDSTRTERDFKNLLRVPQIQQMYAMIEMSTLRHTTLDHKLTYP